MVASERDVRRGIDLIVGRGVGVLDLLRAAARRPDVFVVEVEPGQQGRIAAGRGEPFLNVGSVERRRRSLIDARGR